VGLNVALGKKVGSLVCNSLWKELVNSRRETLPLPREKKKERKKAQGGRLGRRTEFPIEKKKKRKH